MLTKKQERVLMLVALVAHLPWEKTDGGGVRVTVDNSGRRVCPLCAVERELDAKCDSYLAPYSERTGIDRAAINEFIKVADHRGPYLEDKYLPYRKALLEVLGLPPDA